MFGIGMKRAIFKIGLEAEVISNTTEAWNKVEYTAAWLMPDNNLWELPIKSGDPVTGNKGVTISIPKLKPKIAKRFARKSFIDELKVTLSLHFGYIMQRGFAIHVNGIRLKPKTLPLMSGEYLSLIHI